MIYKLSSLTISLGFHFFSVKLPCACKIELSSCWPVFCQFNSHAPFPKFKRVKERIFSPSTRSKCLPQDCTSRKFTVCTIISSSHTHSRHHSLIHQTALYWWGQTFPESLAQFPWNHFARPALQLPYNVHRILVVLYLAPGRTLLDNRKVSLSLLPWESLSVFFVLKNFLKLKKKKSFLQTWWYLLKSFTQNLVDPFPQNLA